MLDPTKHIKILLALEFKGLLPQDPQNIPLQTLRTYELQIR